MQFINPKYDPDNKNSFVQWTSENFKDNAGTGTVRSALIGYFRTIWGSNISVTRTYYDADDVETDSDSSVKHVYKVKVNKLIDGPAFTSASLIPTTSATVSIAVTSSSSEPLSGYFRVTCPDENGNLWTTRHLGFSNWAQGTDFTMQLDIPHT